MDNVMSYSLQLYLKVKETPDADGMILSKKAVLELHIQTVFIHTRKKLGTFKTHIKGT